MNRRSHDRRVQRREKQALKWGANRNGPKAVAPEPLKDAPPARNVKPFPKALQGQRDI